LVATACSSGGTASACQPVTITAPDGTTVDLSGAWDGNDGGIYYIKQVDNCVWWSGVSNFPDQGQYPGQEWIMTFRGTVTGEGLISGDYVDVKSTNPGSGTLKIQLEPRDVDGQTVLILNRTEHTGSSIGVSFWECRVEEPVTTPEPTTDGSAAPVESSPAESPAEEPSAAPAS
jgi:hypothetical protein